MLLPLVKLPLVAEVPAFWLLGLLVREATEVEEAPGGLLVELAIVENIEEDAVLTDANEVEAVGVDEPR